MEAMAFEAVRGRINTGARNHGQVAEQQTPSV
jgi:hypothetical protein